MDEGTEVLMQQRALVQQGPLGGERGNAEREYGTTRGRGGPEGPCWLPEGGQRGTPHQNGVHPPRGRDMGPGSRLRAALGRPGGWPGTREEASGVSRLSASEEVTERAPGGRGGPKPAGSQVREGGRWCRPGQGAGGETAVWASFCACCSKDLLKPFLKMCSCCQMILSPINTFPARVFDALQWAGL